MKDMEVGCGYHPSKFWSTDKIRNRLPASDEVIKTTIDKIDIWTIPRFVEYVYRGKPITIKVRSTAKSGRRSDPDPDTSQEGADPDILTKRLTKADLPGEFYVQDGEIFNDDIDWSTEWFKMNIIWEKSVNGADEPGLQSEFGGYAGWDSKNHVYLRYNSTLAQNEHCIRIRKDPLQAKKDYLNKWFEYAFPNGEAGDDLKDWFLTFADVDNFRITHGYYVGKQSTHVDVIQTGWMANLGLVYCVTEWYSWYREGQSEYQDLKEYLNPCSLNELKENFSTIDHADETEVDYFMSTVVKYIHCKSFEDGECEDDKFLLCNHHFEKYDY